MLDASERLSEESKLATTDQVGEGRKAGAAEADATAAQSVMMEGTKMRTDALVTPEIEREHVQAMYDAIAPHFRCLLLYFLTLTPVVRVSDFLRQG